MLVRRSKIVIRLLVWFSLIALVPLAVVTYITFSISEASLVNEVKTHLVAIANTRSNQFETYALERKKDISGMARVPEIANVLENFKQIYPAESLNSARYTRYDKQVRPFFSAYVDGTLYTDVLLISSDGDVMFSIKQGRDLGTNLYKGPFRNSELARVFDRAKTLLETEISDFQYYAGSDGIAAFIAAPVLKGELVSGVIVFQLNNQEVYKLVNDYTGLGNSGETLVATRIGNEAVFVTPLRHDPQAALKNKVGLGSGDSMAIQRAVQGMRGDSISFDYRGKKVVTVWRYLPSFRWGMVVKIDTSEAYASINNQRNIVLALAGLTLLGVVLIALFVSRSISRPILNLTRIVKLIAGGDLNQSIPVATSHDEIAELGQALGVMTASLRQVLQGVRISETLQTVTGQLSTVSQQQAAGSTEQVNALAQVTLAMQELGRTAEQIAGSATRVAQVTVTTQDQIERVAGAGQITQLKVKQMAGVVETTLDGFERVRYQVDQLGLKMAELAEQSEAINKVVSLIGSIADEVHLLALNAAIEAAGAGQYGERFRVVAQEVKKLASRANLATEEARNLITGLQYRSRAALTELGEGQAQVGVVVEANTGMRQSLQELWLSTEQVTQAVEQLLVMAQQVSEKAGEIKGATQQQYSASEQVIATVRVVEEVSGQTLTATHEIAASSLQLESLTQQLNKVLSQVRLTV